MYWDANNLYGLAMIQPLPVSDFKLLTLKEINRFNLDSIDEYNSIGSIFECDLEYCKELHDLHNDYTLCSEKQKSVQTCCLDIVLILQINME